MLAVCSCYLLIYCLLTACLLLRPCLHQVISFDRVTGLHAVVYREVYIRESNQRGTCAYTQRPYLLPTAYATYYYRMGTSVTRC